MFVGSGEKQKIFRKVAAVIFSKLKTRNDRDETDDLICQNEGEKLAKRYMEEEEFECSFYQQILDERK